MARTYNVRAVALMLSVPPKWVDNLLSHHEIPGVVGGRRGVERRIDATGILAVELARILASDLGVPIARAVTLARASVALRDRDEITHELSAGAALIFQLSAIENRLRSRMVDAIESIGRVPRGRPPRRHT